MPGNESERARKMPRFATPLTDFRLRSAVARPKPYKLGDGGGLYIEVTPDSRLLWRMKFTRDGKDSSVSFGAYPGVSIAMVRNERDMVRRLLAEDRDPVGVKRELAIQGRAAQSPRHRFNLSMDAGGALTINKSSKRLILNAAQVAALRAFLVATEYPENEGE